MPSNRSAVATGRDGRCVRLIGLDVGSTTSSALVVEGRIRQSSVTSRMQLADVATVYQSALVFTPFDGDRIDEGKLTAYVDEWLAQAKMGGREVLAGGVIITGLAAETQNARAVAALAERRVSECLIATAADPSLESWMAFMGSVGALSRTCPHTPIINLDIGGGTTNPALGMNGEVLRTGCFYIGARHLQFVPGTYEICRISKYARQLLQSLQIDKRPGNVLTGAEISAVLDFYTEALCAIARGDQGYFAESGREICSVPFDIPAHFPPAAITFSGGVGELIYAAARGQKLPETTHYGDLGIDLALRILDSGRLCGSLNTHRPSQMGRATVYGLTLHSMEISGATIFLPHPEILPLKNLPIIARISAQDGPERTGEVMRLARNVSHGSCVQLTSALSGWQEVKTMAERLRESIVKADFPPQVPIVLLTESNIGKTIGNCVTQWGKLPVNLIVIDEIVQRDGRFVNLGSLRNGIVPVSFYGI